MSLGDQRCPLVLEIRVIVENLLGSGAGTRLVCIRNPDALVSTKYKKPSIEIRPIGDGTGKDPSQRRKLGKDGGRVKLTER